MSYVSHYEDDQDKLLERLDLIERGLPKAETRKVRWTKAQAEGTYEKVSSLSQDCRNLLAQIQNLLDIATAPNALDLASQINVLKGENIRLQKDAKGVIEERRKREEAETKISKLEQRIRELEEDLRKRKLKKRYIKGPPEKIAQRQARLK